MLIVKPENVGLHIVENFEDTYSTQRKVSAKRCFKQTFQFFFSQVGLCGMVVVYAMIGGFIFRHLEQTNEIHECETTVKKYEEGEAKMLDEMGKIMDAFRTNDEEILAEFKKQLGDFRLFVSTLDNEFFRANCSELIDNGMWTFSDAMLFSVTIITTIGYGNTAPRTYWGRMVCICYGMLGIPLMLLCLGNLASVFGNAFRFVYARILCCGCCIGARRKSNGVNDGKRKGTDGGRSALTEKEEMSKKTGVQKKNSTLSPEEWIKLYERCHSTDDKPSSGVDGIKNTDGCAGGGGDGTGKVNKEDGYGKNSDGNDEDTADDSLEDERIGVPLTVSVGVIAGYLLFGSVLFGIWESWTPMDSSYYCFVTISTVGFGDMVPGSAGFHDEGDGWKMVSASLYMLLGMALLSMCFNLIQDEIAAKCRYLGQKIGLLDE